MTDLTATTALNGTTLDDTVGIHEPATLRFVLDHALAHDTSADDVDVEDCDLGEVIDRVEDARDYWVENDYARTLDEEEQGGSYEQDRLAALHVDMLLAWLRDVDE